MDPSFFVTIDDEFAATDRPRSSETITIRVESLHHYHGQVELQYSSLPEAPDIMLSKYTASVYVPKDGQATDSVVVIFGENVTACQVWAEGSDGVDTSEDDAFVVPS